MSHLPRQAYGARQQATRSADSPATDTSRDSSAMTTGHACDTHRMDIWGFVGTALTVVIGGGIGGALLTFMVASKSHNLARRAQTVELFLKTCEIAHGYPHGDRDKEVGTGEQIAATHLVADFGTRDEWLRGAAEGFLNEQAEWLPRSNNPAKDRLLAANRAAYKKMLGL